VKRQAVLSNMANKQAPIPSDLAEMKQKLAEWRSARPARAPLPETLWESILKLARKHGLYRTAKALPIDYGTLKRRISSESSTSKPESRPSFVELITAPPMGAGCTVEILRIESSSTVDWVQLLGAWRRRGA
jgi:hypothetical protein